MDFDAVAYRERIRSASAAIQGVLRRPPVIAVVLGSGLGLLADSVDDAISLAYEDIPGFPLVTVVGHSGRLVFGSLSGQDVVVMQGRFHPYEGHDIHDVVFPVRVLQTIGVRTIILTNATGGIDPALHPGDLMVIRDQIGLFCESPLRGANLDEFGPRFCDMSHIYDEKLIDIAGRCAEELGIPLRTGVYAYCKGPQFETPAEIRLLAGLGASAVGMSTVPEAIAAVHGGLRVLGISCVTNFAAGISSKPLDHEEVHEVGRASADRLTRLLKSIIGRIGRN